MAITGWNERIWREMDAVVKRGVNTFKHFMAYKGALMVEDDEMFASFKRCAELGALPLVHAENGDIVAALQEKYMAEGLTGPEGHAYSRPPEVEGEAANRAIMIADAAGVPLYIVHVSCEQAHEAIRRARQKGMRVYGEPLIQHLTLDESEYFHKDWDYAARRVMSPPFRDKSHQDSLWAGLAAGSLQVVATDHAAFTTEQKRMGLKGFPSIPNGTGGLEERLAVLWTKGVETGRLTPNEFVAVTSTNIAQILNVYPRKGAIVEGADADIVVWDPKLSKTVSASTQKSIIDYNVFEGMRVTAQARYTLSRGDVVWADGRNSQPQPGRGKFVPRPAVLGAAQGAGGVEGAELAAADRARSDQHPVRGLRVFGDAEAAAFDAAAAHAKAYRRGVAGAPVRAARSYARGAGGLRRAGAGAGAAGGGGGRGAGGEGRGRAPRDDRARTSTAG